MKQQQKRQITRKDNKKPVLKSVFKDCNIDDLIKKGRFHSLCIVEGYYLIGLERGYWLNVSDMFKQFRLIGLSYSRTSFCRFKSGEYIYIPSAFINALSALIDIPYPSAYVIGLPSACSIVQLHSERWGVIPSGLSA